MEQVLPEIQLKVSETILRAEMDGSVPTYVANEARDLAGKVEVWSSVLGFREAIVRTVGQTIFEI